MRRALALAIAVAASALLASSVSADEQRIEVLTPPMEQEIQPTGGDAVQHVEVINQAQTQTVAEHIPPTPTEKAASNAGKFMLGVASAGVALGVMAASLLLL